MASALNLELIAAGKSTQNTYIESFNGKFHDDCLNDHDFSNLAHARAVIAARRRDYNEARSHSSLGRISPAAFALRYRLRAGNTAIWDMSAHSAALPHALDSLGVEMFRFQLRRYQELNALRAELEQRAEQVLSGNTDFKCLKTLPGVGSIIALTILAESGDLRRFAHHRQFLKYCGFDLARSQSGTHRGREQLSKRGNARLRLAFWQAAVCAVRMRENSFRDKYERYIRAAPDNADLRRKALTAVAAKMARVAHSLAKSNQPYRCFFEQSLPSGSIPLCRAVGAETTP